MSAQSLERVNAALTVLWAVIAIPAVLLWKNSVPFLVFVSVYANIAGHVAAWQAARAERAIDG